MRPRVTSTGRMSHRSKPVTTSSVPQILCVDCGKETKLKSRPARCRDCRKKRIKHSCPQCGRPLSAKHVKICRACFVKNAKHPVCIDCGKACNNANATRCQSCYTKRLKGDNNPNWRGGGSCPYCGKVIAREARLCGDCKAIKFPGLPKCKACGGKLSRHDSLKNGTGYCKKCYVGDRNARWNPEREARGQRVRDVSGYTSWRRSVFERDNFCCQKCGYKHGGTLVAHHIHSWKTCPERRLDPTNGVTLCQTCHRRFHRTFGATGNNLKQLTEFMRGRLF